jgi:hypothetical protein
MRFKTTLLVLALRLLAAPIPGEAQPAMHAEPAIHGRPFS